MTLSIYQETIYQETIPLTLTQESSCEQHNATETTLTYDPVFIHAFEQRVQDTILQHQLITSHDKILVAVSGGKDSTVVLHVLHKLGYAFEAVTVDAHIGCYTQKNLENIRAVCAERNITLHEIPFRNAFGASLCYIRDTLNAKGKDYKSCTVCGVLRRSILNKKARELGATVLITGHNQDDEAQAFLMNLFKNKLELSSRMGPRNGIIEDELFIPRAKPLYFIPEKDVIKYSKMMNFPVHYGKCPCSIEGFRNSVKDFINTLEQTIPQVKKNLVQVFLDNLPALRSRYHKITNATLTTCTNCGEPSTNTFCRACQLLKEFRDFAQ